VGCGVEKEPLRGDIFRPCAVSLLTRGVPVFSETYVEEYEKNRQHHSNLQRVPILKPDADQPRASESKPAKSAMAKARVDADRLRAADPVGEDLVHPPVWRMMAMLRNGYRSA